jgi:hypothetical protein
MIKMGSNNNNWNNNWNISVQNGIDWFYNLLVIKEFEINSDDTYLDQFYSFCLRYRRLLGIIALCLLIYIGVYCNGNPGTDKLQSGGGGDPFGGMQVDALTQGFKKTKFDEIGKYKQQLEMEDKKAAVKQEHEQKKAAAAAEQQKASQAASEVAAKQKTQDRMAELKAKPKGKRTTAEAKEYAQLKQTVKADLGSQPKTSTYKGFKSKASGIGQSIKRGVGGVVDLPGKGLSSVGDKTIGAASRFAVSSGEEYKAQALAQGGQTFSELRAKGMASGSIMGSKTLGSIGSVGYYATGKMKEYAGWFYQILYAIAISLAICMVVLPSISFFFIGLICYFLLKYKMARMKAF